MLILSKIVYVFITPLTWLLIALIISVLAKRKRIKRVARISSLAIVLFFSNTFIYKEILRGWEIHAVSFESVNHHDVALVLGGMFEYDHSVDRISVRRGADRIWQALTLYNQKK
ncbi:hypothetical protein CW751_08595 [Brumimicrobium salinarum]|uniref:Uncharacterized protein n=2 Tax=Brumimicrobium salinarum TaxID=2058658 RepID=A0A2I0R2M6_9FLAO|nr:hypothetical protein CW751_08595 [Brumimicrobium salinarum]